MRKLASIQRIKAIEAIEGADAIEKAGVLGWQLVVKKNEYQVGAWCVYCEIDSILPDRPEFEFLKPRGMRIKTIRLRGQISQGICLPLSILPANTPIEEDTDVTELLGIIKYEPPIPAQLAGNAKGLFPSFIPKTDETRVQVLQNVLDKYAGELCYIAEKLDGSSVTYYIRNGEFGVCTRNLELLEEANNSLWKVARATDLEAKMRSIGENIAFQGEIIGEGIQSNKYKLSGQTVRFFNVFKIDAYTYLSYEDFMALMQSLNLPTVPIINTEYLLSNNIEALVALATRRSVLLSTTWAEGIVIRPLIEAQGMFGRVSFKAINPEFLLKHGE